MSAEGEKRRILEALGSIETLKNVSRSWPRQQAALPCAVVTATGRRTGWGRVSDGNGILCALLCPDGNGSG